MVLVLVMVMVLVLDMVMVQVFYKEEANVFIFRGSCSHRTRRRKSSK